MWASVLGGWRRRPEQPSGGRRGEGALPALALAAGRLAGAVSCFLQPRDVRKGGRTAAAAPLGRGGRAWRRDGGGGGSRGEGRGRAGRRCPGDEAGHGGGSRGEGRHVAASRPRDITTSMRRLRTFVGPTPRRTPSLRSPDPPPLLLDPPVTSLPGAGGEPRDPVRAGSSSRPGSSSQEACRSSGQQDAGSAPGCNIPVFITIKGEC